MDMLKDGMGGRFIEAMGNESSMDDVFAKLLASESEKERVYAQLFSFTRELHQSYLERQAAYQQLNMYVLDLHKVLAERDAALLAAEAAARTKSQLLANVSHEFRTPLTTAIGFVDILLREPAAADGEDLLKRVLGAMRRLQGMVENMLTMVRLDLDESRTSSGSTDVVALLNGLVDKFSDRAKSKGVAIRCHFPAKVPAPAPVASLRLGRALENLLDNALKFTEQGEVLLTLQADDRTGLPLSIEVTDTGIGLELSHLDELLLPFEQADTSDTRHYQGAGLGLTVTNALLETISCRLEVHSTPGLGSRFIILLPGTTAALTSQPMPAQPLEKTKETG